MTEDEMVGWHHRLDGHEFEQALGDNGQGSLVCCSPWGRKESDTTECLPGLRRPLEKVSKVGHFSLFEREPAASVVRANLYKAHSTDCCLSAASRDQL